MVGRYAFIIKLKHQCHSSQWGERVYGTQSWKERLLLCESVFVLIDKWTLTLKNGKRQAFIMKSKHQCHLSYRVEWVYGMKSWIERRLLCESVFVLIDRWTLIIKIGRKKSFSYETKESMSLIPKRRMSLWCPIMKRNEIVMWICACRNWQTNFNLKKLWKEKLFLWKQSVNVIYPNE